MWQKRKNWPLFNNYVDRRSPRRASQILKRTRLPHFKIRHVNRGLSILSVFESGFILGLDTEILNISSRLGKKGFAARRDNSKPFQRLSTKYYVRYFIIGHISRSFQLFNSENSWGPTSPGQGALIVGPNKEQVENNKSLQFVSFISYLEPFGRSWPVNSSMK